MTTKAAGAGVDISEFVDLTKNSKRKPCSVATVVQALDFEEAGKLTAALIAPPAEITHSAIVTWCSRRGQRLDSGAVSRHRNRKCSCE